MTVKSDVWNYFTDYGNGTPRGGFEVTPVHLWVTILLSVTSATIWLLHGLQFHLIPICVCLVACVLSEAHLYIMGYALVERQKAMFYWSFGVLLIIFVFRLRRILSFNAWLKKPTDLQRLTALLLPKQAVERCDSQGYRSHLPPSPKRRRKTRFEEIPSWVSGKQIIFVGASSALMYKLSEWDKYPLTATSLSSWVALTIIIIALEQKLSWTGSLVRVFRRFRPFRDARGPWVVSSQRLPKGSTPLLAFINRKSGASSLGDVLLHQFEYLGLNELQVWDVSLGKPAIAFQPWLECLENGVQIKVLVCGGDGTVGWVLGDEGLDSLPEAMRANVSVGVLPLGTGNDLAQTLGWGGGFDSSINLMAVLKQLVHANDVLIDRWDVSIGDEHGNSSLETSTMEATCDDFVTVDSKRTTRSGMVYSSKKKDPNPNPNINPNPTTSSSMTKGQKNETPTHTKKRVMNCYCGFGCGARIALNFHVLFYH